MPHPILVPCPQNPANPRCIQIIHPYSLGWSAAMTTSITLRSLLEGFSPPAVWQCPHGLLVLQLKVFIPSSMQPCVKHLPIGGGVNVQSETRNSFAELQGVCV